MKVNETDFETPDLLMDLEKTFSTSRGTLLEHSLVSSTVCFLLLSLSLLIGKGMGVEEKPVFKMKAVKELKILDTKQAQNICKYFKQLKYVST